MGYCSNVWTRSLLFMFVRILKKILSLCPFASLGVLVLNCFANIVKLQRINIPAKCFLLKLC